MKKLNKVLVVTGLFAGLSAFPAMAGEWQQTENIWKFQNNDGSYAANGWMQDTERDSAWYYFDANGNMLANQWILSNGQWYYLGADGRMMTNTTTPDGYYVDGNGVWNGAAANNQKSTEEILNSYYDQIESYLDEIYSDYEPDYDYSYDYGKKYETEQPVKEDTVEETEPEEETQSDMDKFIEEQQKRQEEQNARLIEQYEERIKDLEKDLEDAKYDLERAKNQKTVRVYREGEGCVYEADENKGNAAERKVESIEENIEFYEDLIASLK